MDESKAGRSVAPSRAGHWDDLYTRCASDRLSWHESTPQRSLEAISEVATWLDAPIVDVGGGDGRLVDLLIDHGYRRITVVDISPRGLLRARARLGAAADQVDWVSDDIGAPFEAGAALAWSRAPFAVWHDRAVFHFLSEPAQQEAYVARLRAAVAHGGHVFLSAFDETGPERCSGLPVVRRSLEALMRVLPGDFELCSAARFRHRTPAGDEQAFVCCAWQRIR